MVDYRKRFAMEFLCYKCVTLFLERLLVYGFTYFLSILNEIEKSNYCSDKNISSFKKVGNMFIGYAINVFILKMILVALEGRRFVAMELLKEGFSLLIPAVLAFYILAEVFK